MIASLVLAQKCVCQTPHPCAGAVSKGISPKGGAFSPPYGMSPTGWPVSLCWRPCWTERMLCTLWLPLKLSCPLCYVGKWGVKVTSPRKPWLELFLIRVVPPLKMWKIPPQRRSLAFCYCRGRAAQGGEMTFLEVPVGASSRSHTDSSSHSSSSWHLLISLSVWCFKRPECQKMCLFLAGNGIFDLPQHFWHLVPWLVLHVWSCICKATLKTWL